MNVKKIIEILKVVADDVTPVSNARLAAAIVYRGRIISIGTNQDKTHPFAAEYSRHPDAIYLHAETDAIFKAKKRLTARELSRSTLVIVRMKLEKLPSKSKAVKYKQMFGLSKPCPGCADCIGAHGIKTLIYTEDSEITDLKFTTEHKGI